MEIVLMPQSGTHMKPILIHLGYEIGSGAPVEIPLRHLAVTGQTQESGKTTTLEALISRSNLRAVAFITKRGESGFSHARTIPPYFQERADWDFVESILESAMKQRMKFERAWIVKACKSASTLAGVQINVAKLQKEAKRSMDQDMFMLLGEYLKRVVPLIAALPKSPRLELAPGLNVMDLSAYPEELQMLVVSSTLRYVYQHEQNVVTIIPEAWKFVPQGRNTPVKIEAEHLVREGAGIKNYVWIDSQDMAGVEKLILRAASVWIIGVQREMNELKRALGNIPAGIKRPKPEEVAQLGIGQFYACYHDHIHKTYVQPAWMSNTDARNIAIGKKQIGDAPEAPPKPMEETTVTPQEAKRLETENASLKARVHELETALARLQGIPQTESQPAPPPALRYTEPPQGEPFDLNTIYRYVKAQLMKEPALLRIALSQPELEITITHNTITATGDDLRGKIAQLIASGFFDNGVTGAAVMKELNRLGHAPGVGTLYDELRALTTLGFLTAEQGKDARKRDVTMYQTSKTAKIRIIEREE
jgi:hypothetical protein